jgi:hypothetical protein
MEDKVFHNMAYVDADGSYGSGALAVFHPDRLTDKQWGLLANLRDSERIEYVFAILNDKDLSYWEDEDE